MGFGRGKVILLGEHGVVHGRPALAAGLGRGAHAEARAAAADLLELPGLGLSLAPDLDSDEDLSRAFAVALAGYGARPHPVAVRCALELPPGAGLGSSAAIGVAVVDALDAFYGVARSPEARGAYCLGWEEVFHGNPSGVDNTMAAVGGVAIYRRGAPLERLWPKAPLRLAVAFSGERSSTKAMVAAVARYAERSPAEATKIFDAMEALVGASRAPLEEGKLSHLGQLFDMNHSLLSSLMLSTERLETLCAAARGAGALGAKVTGAGGGGCMIALLDAEDDGAAVLEALRREGADPFVAEAGA